MTHDHPHDNPLDLLGVGIGPLNLSLAALAHPLTDLTTAFYDQNPAFQWHPGILVDGATVQVPFLADLVTLADPANPWSFLNHLKTRERLFPFYFAEQFHIQRTEYDAYCRWVAENLPTTHFSHRVDAIHWNPAAAVFEVDHTHLDPHSDTETTSRTHTRNLSIATGTTPHIPTPLRPLADAPGTPVIHSADYLKHRPHILTAPHITVIGAGQSGAEIFLDLLRTRPPGHERLTWLARTPAFAPMEYSKLGLEHFTPDYTQYFHDLPEPARDRLLPQQWQLHKGISHTTITAIHQELYRRTINGGWPDTHLTPAVTVRTAGRLGTHAVELHLEHHEQNTRSRLTTNYVILATGYQERPLDNLLASLSPYIRRDAADRPRTDHHHRLLLDRTVTGTVYLMGATRHAHGPGTPDLGLAAWRSATILNDITGHTHYPLPTRTAFTTFGLTPTTRTVPTARPALTQ